MIDFIHYFFNPNCWNIFCNRIVKRGWQFFAKVNNVFDCEHNSGGLLGEHRFDASTGAFTGNEVNPAFYAPGAPRAG